MNINYIRLSDSLVKIIYKNGTAYGEFYLTLNPDGTGSIDPKDPAFSKDLCDAFILTFGFSKFTKNKERMVS